MSVFGSLFATAAAALEASGAAELPSRATSALARALEWDGTKGPSLLASTAACSSSGSV